MRSRKSFFIFLEWDLMIKEKDENGLLEVFDFFFEFTNKACFCQKLSTLKVSKDIVPSASH